MKVSLQLLPMTYKYQSPNKRYCRKRRVQFPRPHSMGTKVFAENAHISSRASKNSYENWELSDQYKKYDATYLTICLVPERVRIYLMAKS